VFAKLRRVTRPWRVLIGGGAALSILILAQIAWLVGDGLTDELAPADVIVVLGNKVEPSGQPSARLQARLQRAAEVYRGGFAPKILVSGGTGKEGFDESLVMRDWLVEQGIPRAAIDMNPDGYDSLHTARSSRKWLHENGKRSVIVVSQYWHIMRCRIAMRKIGIRPVFTAHARYFAPRDIYSIAREIPAVWKYLLLRTESPGKRATAVP